MSSLFTTHYYDIGKVDCNKTYTLIPFGDVHRHAPLCNVDRWLNFCEWGKNRKDTYYIGMGDYEDLLSTTERKMMNAAGLHESTKKTFEDLMEDHVNEFYKEIKFMKGRCIGLLEGNHYGVFSDGSTTTQMLCRLLGCKYLGVSSFVRLGFKGHGNARSSLDIFANHGKGASRLVGGSLNTVQSMVDVADADIYLMGHDHKKSVATKTRLVLSGGNGNLRITHKKILFGRTGSFLIGYKGDAESYVSAKCLPPTDLGVLRVNMTPKRDKHTENGKQSDTFYIDTHGSI